MIHCRSSFAYTRSWVFPSLMVSLSCITACLSHGSWQGDYPDVSIYSAGIKGRTAKAAGISAGTFGSFVITTSGHTLAFGVNASGQLGFTATVRPQLSSLCIGEEMKGICSTSTLHRLMTLRSSLLARILEKQSLPDFKIIGCWITTQPLKQRKRHHLVHINYKSCGCSVPLRAVSLILRRMEK